MVGISRKDMILKIRCEGRLTVGVKAISCSGVTSSGSWKMAILLLD